MSLSSLVRTLASEVIPATLQAMSLEGERWGLSARRGGQRPQAPSSLLASPFRQNLPTFYLWRGQSLDMFNKETRPQVFQQAHPRHLKQGKEMNTQQLNQSPEDSATQKKAWPVADRQANNTAGEFSPNSEVWQVVTVGEGHRGRVEACWVPIEAQCPFSLHVSRGLLRPSSSQPHSLHHCGQGSCWVGCHSPDKGIRPTPQQRVSARARPALHQLYLR